MAASRRKIAEEDLDGEWQLVSDDLACKMIECQDGYVVVWAKATLTSEDHFELEILRIDEQPYQ